METRIKHILSIKSYGNKWDWIILTERDLIVDIIPLTLVKIRRIEAPRNFLKC